jgi:predicted ATPase/class 3 adenylate cyclase
MRALADDGRTADSLRLFQRFRAVLSDDVGLDPSSELRALETEILAATDDVRTPAAPPTGSTTLPDGTVTFMFTDIEASTQRWQADETRMSAELGDHDRLLEQVVSDHAGTVFKHTGDGVCAVFTSASAAIDAAVAAQHGLALPVRMGIHTGDAERRGHDYFGPTLNRVARVMDAGHGGQILVSSATAALIDRDLTDLGRHRLKGLSSPEQIFQVGDGDFPPLRVERDRKGNLPTESSSFIGRADDIDTIAERVANDHVVTLLGVGGTGKTRLAIEVAHALAPTFPDGCWLAELAPINLPEAVPFAIAAGLGLSAPQSGDIIDHVIKRIRHQRLLLIVDNCEHLLSTAADAVERIAAACPAVTVLSTSREPLMVNGETLSPVPWLTLDDAIELFLARAATEAPDLQLDEAQHAAVADLCERLDQLPLAIELAASRLRSLTPIELLGSIDERLRLLIGGRRSRMERHQTMRGTLDWSYDLCSPTEQDVFDRLSVFPSTFDLTSARAVGSGGIADELDVIDVVPRLVDRSLLQRVAADDGTSRYRMLETMRAYGREHLQHAGTADEARERHAHHVAERLRPLGLRTCGPDEAAVFAEMATWLADAVTAVDWAAEHEQWDVAQECKLAGYAAGMRQMVELNERIADAARQATGELPLDITLVPGDRLSHADVGLGALDAIIEGRWRAPTDRFVIPPHMYADRQLERAECERVIASLDDLAEAAPGTRAIAFFGTIMLACDNNLVDLAEPLVDRFSVLADEYQSPLTNLRVATMRASTAALRGDWHDSVRWSEAVLDGLERGPIYAGTAWIAVHTGFKRLRTRAAAGLPITGHHLREPWKVLVSEGVEIQQWVGAVSTAPALAALGHSELACRFLSFVRADERMFEYFSEPTHTVFAAVGLDWERDSAGPCTDSLDDLLAELFAVADELDRM